MFQISTADESELLKLVKNRFLQDRAMLQWWPVKGEDIPTPNTKKIVMLTPFFQRGFGLPTCKFLCDLLHHNQIELVHLNPNSVLQIVIFVQLCESFLAIPPNFPLFKSYFFLKYQPSANNWKVVGGISIQTHPHNGFLDLLMKTSLKGWHSPGFIAKTMNPASHPLSIDSLSSMETGWKTLPLSNSPS
jgi:hypothetical protein